MADITRGKVAHMSPQNIADDLGVPVQTVYKWLSADKTLKRLKVGRHVRVRPDDYREWLDTKAVA